MGVSRSDLKGRYMEPDDFENLCWNVCGEWQCPQYHLITQKAREDFKDYVEKRQGKWGVKSPYLSLIGHVVLAEMSNPTVIFTRRDLDKSAQSLAVRERMPFDLCKFIQCQYYTGIYNTLKYVAANQVKHATVDYEGLMANPEQTIKSIAEFIEMPFVDSAVSVVRV